MRGGYGQEFQADAGRPGPADCGVGNQDGCGFSRDMQLYGQLHAGKGADDTFYTAALDRKVSDGSCMAELVLVHQSAGERH